LGTWDFSWGRSRRNRTLVKSKNNPGTPLPNSLPWLECVDDELSALEVKIYLSLLQVMLQLEAQDLKERLKAVRNFSESNQVLADFPPPPPDPEYRGPTLAHWVDPRTSKMEPAEV
jgi:hypothetical protein